MQGEHLGQSYKELQMKQQQQQLKESQSQMEQQFNSKKKLAQLAKRQAVQTL